MHRQETVDCLKKFNARRKLKVRNFTFLWGGRLGRVRNEILYEKTTFQQRLLNVQTSVVLLFSFWVFSKWNTTLELSLQWRARISVAVCAVVPPFRGKELCNLIALCETKNMMDVLLSGNKKTKQTNKNPLTESKTRRRLVIKDCLFVRSKICISNINFIYSSFWQGAILTTMLATRNFSGTCVKNSPYSLLSPL